MFINFSGTFSSFTDSPDNKRLTSSHITCCKYLRNISLIIFFCCFYISSFIELHTEFLNQSLMFRMNKSHCKQGKVAIQDPFTVSYFYKLSRSVICA